MASTTVEIRETPTLELGTLLDAGEGAVVTLSAGKTRLAAHRAVLVARSPVFSAMFSHDTLEASSGEVTISDVEGPVLRQLLAFLYTGRAPQLPGTAAQLLAAADKYGVPALKHSCEQQVTEQLSVENAAAVALLAVKHSCHSLRTATVAFIKAHLEVMTTQGWAEAVHSDPGAIVEVTRLLAEPPPQTSAPATADRRTAHTAAADSRSTATVATQLYSDCDQTPAAAAPALAPLNASAISRIRNLPAKERADRLIEAAKEGTTQEVRTLLAAGADVGAEDRNGSKWSALHWAADGGHLEVAQCLLGAGAEVDARTIREATPLHLAAARGHAAVVRLLLVSSADPNARNMERLTPLHWAALRGHAEVATALLEAGADRAPRNIGGRTPLDGAIERNHRHLVQMLE